MGSKGDVKCMEKHKQASDRVDRGSVEREDRRLSDRVKVFVGVECEDLDPTNRFQSSSSSDDA